MKNLTITTYQTPAGQLVYFDENGLQYNLLNAELDGLNGLNGKFFDRVKKTVKNIFVPLPLRPLVNKIQNKKENAAIATKAGTDAVNKAVASGQLVPVSQQTVPVASESANDFAEPDSGGISLTPTTIAIGASSALLIAFLVWYFVFRKKSAK